MTVNNKKQTKPSKDKIRKTLIKLRDNGIEPRLDFLKEFSMFDDETQDNLILTFKKYPEMEVRYKWT
ncbi:MAG TPA: hypothetical protein DCM10_17385 [Xanthomarina gelatinilytica]|nr:hypothetical protein [Xanthomarina gelatinilytica]